MQQKGIIPAGKLEMVQKYCKTKPALKEEQIMWWLFEKVSETAEEIIYR